jgi:hypothetical protein
MSNASEMRLNRSELLQDQVNLAYSDIDSSNEAP